MRNSILNTIYTHGGTTTKEEIIASLKQGHPSFGWLPSRWLLGLKYNRLTVGAALYNLTSDGFVTVKGGKIHLTRYAQLMVEQPIIATDRVYTPARRKLRLMHSR